MLNPDYKKNPYDYLCRLLFCTLLSWISPYKIWTSSTTSDTLKGQQHLSHSANSIRYTSSRHSITLCVQASHYDPVWRKRRRRLMRRVMEKFYRSSQGRHNVALNMDRDWRRYDLPAKMAPETEDLSTQLSLTLPEENNRLEMTKWGDNATLHSMSK